MAVARYVALLIPARCPKRGADYQIPHSNSSGHVSSSTFDTDIEHNCRVTKQSTSWTFRAWRALADVKGLTKIQRLNRKVAVSVPVSRVFVDTGYTSRRAEKSGYRIPVGRGFPHRLYRPWGPHVLLYNQHRLILPGVKLPAHGVNHPPPSSAEVKERVELCYFPPSGFPWSVLVWPLPFCLHWFTWLEI